MFLSSAHFRRKTSWKFKRGVAAAEEKEKEGRTELEIRGRRKLAESVQERERQQHVLQHVCVIVCPLQNTHGPAVAACTVS